MSKRKQLRELVEARQGLIVPGAYDGVSARLVEAAGFEAVYMTGYGTSASRLGMPDMGFAGLAEMSDQARNLAAAISVPLISDADTGYGNALNVRRTVQAYEAAGVAAMHIEDQSLPKRCGHMAGKNVVPADEFGLKIRAAVEARTDPDLMIIARTDAISVTGFDDALHRAELAAKAGADMLFIEAMEDEAQFEKVTSEFDLPLLFNYTTSGQRTPLIPIEELRRMRYAVIIMPTQSLLIATAAVRSFLARLKAGEDARSLSSEGMQWSEFNTFIGADEQMAIGAKYGSS